MVKFCPTCEKVLRRKKKEDGTILIECPVCEYSEPYLRDRKKKKMSTALEKKIRDHKTRIDDGGNKKEMAELNPKTKVVCPKCEHDEAFYEQFQTRSADEPATTFYSCTKCGHRWREY